ncbi:glutathione S-transferase family protein [Amaricoccus tamworthensis]|uniref:glutathione S-transferase family protein n=1 Tax=Amaricoccus tamworthensis TaxID=57002 RepID=UPI003C7C233F
MLKLLTFAPAFGEPSASGFCTKAMCLLEMAGLDWEPDICFNPAEMPKQKLPVLRDGDHFIPDSEQIADYLAATYGADLWWGVNSERKAVGQAVVRMVEENLYFAVMHDRWADDRNWEVILGLFFGGVPEPMRDTVSNEARAGAIATLVGQGLGRHTERERFERVRKDLESIRTILGDREFLLGDAPVYADACVVPMLRGAAATPHETMLSAWIKKDAALMAYMERGAKALYPRNKTGLVEYMDDAGPVPAVA